MWYMWDVVWIWTHQSCPPGISNWRTVVFLHRNANILVLFRDKCCFCEEKCKNTSKTPYRCAHLLPGAILAQSLQKAFCRRHLVHYGDCHVLPPQPVIAVPVSEKHEVVHCWIKSSYFLLLLSFHLNISANGMSYTASPLFCWFHHNISPWRQKALHLVNGVLGELPCW